MKQDKESRFDSIVARLKARIKDLAREADDV
jgi:hypothetical protein